MSFMNKGDIMTNSELKDLLLKTFDGEILTEDSVINNSSWSVPGSGGNSYTVEFDKWHKKYTCNCKGFVFRRKCRHVVHIQDEIKKALFA